MTHPDLVSWILSAWICVAFVVFVIVHLTLLGKRIQAWFDRRFPGNPPSVYQTLNILNIESDASDRHRSKKPDGI